MKSPRLLPEEIILPEIADANDEDFMGVEYIDTDKVMKAFKKYKCRQKTGLTVSRDKNAWKTKQKEGSILSDTSKISIFFAIQKTTRDKSSSLMQP